MKRFLVFVALLLIAFAAGFWYLGPYNPAWQ